MTTKLDRDQLCIIYEALVSLLDIDPDADDAHKVAELIALFKGRKEGVITLGAKHD